jgi:hypothetical protein
MRRGQDGLCVVDLLVSPGTQALNVTFSPVSYFSQDETHAVMQEVIDNVKTNGAFLSSVERNRVIASVFNMFLDAVTCRKHEGFREEREWRAIYSPTMRASKLMEFSTEIIEGIPQPIFKVPMDAAASPELADIDIARIFDRLIIGPSQFPEVMRQAFATALANAGVSKATDRVFISNIPIRA